MRLFLIFWAVLGIGIMAGADPFHERFPDTKFEPLLYQFPKMAVDLGVGLWAYPLPVDYDGDGDHDLLVACPGFPSNGIYFFENATGNTTFPLFKPGVWLCPAPRQMTVSTIGDKWLLMSENQLFDGFRQKQFTPTGTVHYKPDFYADGRDRQWSLVDFDGDGIHDLIIGTSDWRGYGWDEGFNAKGKWTREPLHGYVYFIKNTGTNDAPNYAKSEPIQAGDKPVDVFGTPSPTFADFDRDGDLDLVCGEFLDRLTYFENIGTRTAPRYAKGRFLQHDGNTIRMDLEMLQVTAIDWDKDGDVDLIVGQEDGRVALLENTGVVHKKMPDFLPPVFFQQEPDRVKVGVLPTPVSVDWDGDGDEDLISGNTAGNICFVENLDGGNPPQWLPPVPLAADGKIIHIQAGPNGSIQGPAEAKWGYTVLNVADWDQDGLPDIVVNSIWGEVLWYRNIGTRTKPKLDKARPIEVQWDGPTPKPEWVWWKPKGKQLVTQWRTTPQIIDLNKDGLNDLVMLDQEGYLAFFERKQIKNKLVLKHPQRIFFSDDGQLLRLNEKRAGKSGRRKFTMTDWDRDGKIDILLDGQNVDFLRNVGDANHPWMFHNEGKVDPLKLAGHDTCPTTVDWDKNGIPDLLLSAEDGFFYYLKNPAAK